MLAASRFGRSSSVGLGLVLAGDGLVGTAIGITLVQSKWFGEIAGLMLGAYFAGLALGALYAPGVTQRLGPVRARAAYVAAASIGALLMAMAPVVVLWIVLRLMSGFALAGLLRVGDGVAPTETHEQPTKAFLGLAVVSQFVFALGQPVLMLYGARRIETYMTAVMVIALGAALIGVPESAPSPNAAPRLGVRDLFRVTPLGAAAVVAAGALLGQLLVLGPAWATLMELTVGEESLLMVLLLVGGLVLQLALGGVLQRSDRRVFIAGTAAAIAVLSTGFAFSATSSLALGAPLVFIVGALLFFLYPLGWAHANDVLEPVDRPRATDTLLVVFGVGGALGPLLAATLMRYYGPVGFAASMAVFATPLAAYAFYQVLASGVSIPTRTHFVPVGHPFTVAGCTPPLETLPFVAQPGAGLPAAGTASNPGFGGFPPPPPLPSFGGAPQADPSGSGSAPGGNAGGGPTP